MLQSSKPPTLSSISLLIANPFFLIHKKTHQPATEKKTPPPPPRAQQSSLYTPRVMLTTPERIHILKRRISVNRISPVASILYCAVKSAHACAGVTRRAKSVTWLYGAAAARGWKRESEWKCLELRFSVTIDERYYYRVYPLSLVAYSFDFRSFGSFAFFFSFTRTNSLSCTLVFDGKGR